MQICRITTDNLNLIPEFMSVNFIGTIDISYVNKSFKYFINKSTSQKDFTFPTSKPNNIMEFNDKHYGFIIIENGEYIGHAVVEHKFNNTLYIEDFDISPKYRSQKYADILMSFLENHAKNCNLKGISLEVQSNNVIAFLFYINYGFIIGGFDSLFYEMTRQKGETAIYLYKLF